MLLSCLGSPAQEDLGANPPTEARTPAETSFEHALTLQKNGLVQPAFQEFSKAVSLAPGNREYLMARDLLSSQLASSYIERGNSLANFGDLQGAQAQFKKALTLDPTNSYAQQRLHDVTEDPEHEHVLQLLASVEDVSVKPNPGKSSFHIHGDTRELYDAIARAFGIGVSYDSSLTTARVRFDVDDLDFYTAMRLAGKVTHTFWAPLESKRVIVASDTQEMRREYERMALQTFYVSNAATPAELTDVANVLRNVFDVKLVSVVPDKNVITVRAPKEEMKKISAVLDDTVRGRPEVLLDIKTYEIDLSRMREAGLSLQNTFSIFNVYAAIYAALGPNAQTVINQLQQTGSINPSSIPISSLGSLQNSPLLQPFIFFGKGWGLTAINVSPVTGQFSQNNAYTTDLEHVTLRALNGQAATMTIGNRIPISLGSFTNVSITTTGQPQVGTAFPQIQYEDLGVIFKATPHLQSSDHVILEVDLQIKGLGAQSLNGVPVLTNRHYAGSITVKDGEPSVVAGAVEDEVDKSTAGYPGIGPAGTILNNTNSNQHTRTEILIVVTPHIVRKSYRQLENVVWDTTQ